MFWNIMTLIGALLGSSIGDPKVWGLDAAAAAAFVALVWPRLKNSRMRLTGFFSAFAAIISSPFVPVGVPILLAGAVGVAIWALPNKART